MDLLRDWNVVLGSTSPRRRQLLRESGVEVTVASPAVDDGELRPGEVDPEEWVMALAHLKAKSIQHDGPWEPEAIVLAADTICVHSGAIIGQPVDEAHARAMLRQMSDETHRTVSGVCLFHPASAHRSMFVDSALVRVGVLSDEMIETYLQSNGWVGKAGAYNLSERISDGWPIECDGDPTTVMGLPMRRLPHWMRGFCDRLTQFRGGASS